MFIIGNLINVRRQDVFKATKSNDDGAIRGLAAKQTAAGARYLEIGLNQSWESAADTMKWLVESVQKEVQAPLCLTSSNPEALAAGLELCRFGVPFVNAVTAEAQRLKALLPLIGLHEAKIIALLIDDDGIPNSTEKRCQIAERLIDVLRNRGVRDEDIHIDPLVTTLCMSTAAGVTVLETIRILKAKYPQVNFVCDLENISYGLPNREMINRVFMIDLTMAGVDGFLLDPSTREMTESLSIQKMLLGQDAHCREYLTMFRREIESRAERGSVYAADEGR